MNIEAFTELIPMLKSAIVYTIPLAFSLTALKMFIRIISMGTTDSFFDVIFERICDFIDWIKSIFHKSSKKKSIEFYYGKQGAGMSSVDNGFFNSDVYNSNNRTDC